MAAVLSLWMVSGSVWGQGDEGLARGLVRPSQTVTLRSPLNEPLKALHVAEGERVEAGQKLAELDSREQSLVVRASRLEAESELRVRRAELALEEAQFSLSQVEDLASRDVAGSWEVRRSQLQAAQASVDHELAKQDLEQARLSYERERQRLSRYTVEAPFAGTIQRIEAEPGTLLSGEQPILRLVALDPLHAEVYMPIGSYGDLELGQTYELEAGPPVGGVLEGELMTVDPVLDTASQSFRCVFRIENPDSSLPAGFTVRVR